MPTGQLGNETLFRGPAGVLTYEGWTLLRRASPAASVASMDLREFKEVNLQLTRPVADQLLQALEVELAWQGGHAFGVAHVSGDEFWFQGAPEELEAFKAKLRDSLHTFTYTGDAPGMTPRRVNTVEIAMGIAATEQEADHERLPEDKRSFVPDDAWRAAAFTDVPPAGSDLRGQGVVSGSQLGPGQRNDLSWLDAGGGTGGAEVGLKRLQASEAVWLAAAERAARELASARGETDAGGDDAGARKWKAEFDYARAQLGHVRSAINGGALFQGDGSSRPRGWSTRVREGVRNLFRVILTKDANLSTFLHESGHVYFDILGDLAGQNDASDRVKNQRDAVLKFTGLKDLADVQARLDGARHRQGGGGRWAGQRGRPAAADAG